MFSKNRKETMSFPEGSTRDDEGTVCQVRFTSMRGITAFIRAVDNL